MDSQQVLSMGWGKPEVGLTRQAAHGHLAVLFPKWRNCSSGERARRGPGVGTDDCHELSLMEMG